MNRFYSHRVCRIFTFLLLLLASPSFAQTSTPSDNQAPVWIQIESLPSLQRGIDRAQDYANSLDAVSGFQSRGRYAIVLGPFLAPDAETKINEWLRLGQIPNDSFVTDGAILEQQFWPIGALDTAAAIIARSAQTPQSSTDAVSKPAQEPLETLRQSRRAERSLSRDAKKEIQTALKWEGFYAGAIDGAFGRGTRGSISDYQAHMSYEPTGVLSTEQYAELLNLYYSVFDGLGFTTITHPQAGIEISIPQSILKTGPVAPPFVHYDAHNADGIRMLLISQKGDQATLYGLYDIMQTLEIVPAEGPRALKTNSFTLRGTNDKIDSYTYATLKDGMIKGYTLIWPANDERRLSRVREKIQASFKTTDAVLNDADRSADLEQAIDLVSGLEIRKPRWSMSGAFITAKGHVLTSEAVTKSCARITIDGETEATVSFAQSGIAILTPDTDMAPLGVATLAATRPILNSDVAFAGYSYEGVLSAPSVTFGTLMDVRGLNGENDLYRLKATALTGDQGGPVFAMNGAMIGMLSQQPESARSLPKDVQFSIAAPAISRIISENGLTPSLTENIETLTPEGLTETAMASTVLVSCWDQ
ncbi:MAG: serine protease [Halocynthiibacter sp.]